MKENNSVRRSNCLALVVSYVVAHSILVPAAAAPGAPVRKPPVSVKAQPLLTGKAKEEWDLGEAALKSGSFDQAVRHFKAVVQLAPDHSRAHERLGSALAASEKYEDGAAEERKAAALDAKDYLPHLILGRILLVLKGEKEGVDEAQKAYDINPFACAAFLNFANKDRFDPHRWFVQANYWKEMAAAQRAAEAAKPGEDANKSGGETGKSGGESARPESNSGKSGGESESAGAVSDSDKSGGDTARAGSGTGQPSGGETEAKPVSSDSPAK
ncbi:MAG TPA: tetratricopeptide repeat protein [Chroococcales cyanobacterium]